MQTWGVKAHGAGELTAIKRSIREVIGGVLDESIDRSIGALPFQGFNSLLKAVEAERHIR
jgi:hypothetical protein